MTPSSGIVDQPSSKLAAALPCQANANCLPAWSALAGAARPGAACRQSRPHSSLLRSGVIIRDVSDQPSSKRAAALWCEAGANCLSVWLALAGAACRQRRAAFLFALHRSRPQPGICHFQHACGCVAVPSECKLFACLAGTRRSCLPTQAAAFLFALQWSRPQGSVTSSKRAAAVPCQADANCVSVWPALAGAACRQRQPPSSLLCSTAILRDLSIGH